MPCSYTRRTISPRRPDCAPGPGRRRLLHRLLRAERRGSQFAYASLVDLRTGEVVWFNVLQTGSQLPGIKFGDIRTPQEGAAQMVERLVGG